MRASRAVILAGGCAAILTAGWVVSPKELPTLDLVPEAEADPNATATSTEPTAEPTAPTAAPTSSTASPSSTAPTDSATAEPTEPAPSEPAPVEVTVDGPVVNNARGDFQARITVKDGVVTDVRALAAGTEDAQSIKINATAIPELSARVLAAQSADVEAVSGASFSSPGFLESVAGAFAQAGL